MSALERLFSLPYEVSIIGISEFLLSYSIIICRSDSEQDVEPITGSFLDYLLSID